MTSNNTTSNNTASTQLTPPLAAPLGGFQDIDGRRIFVHRAGSGDGPAVVFLPGASAVGLDYFGIQQQVAQFTTAVVYDRAGTGYSDPAALPRTAAEVATELHELLHAQGIAGPYVLVAHSLGGAYAHRFAQLYPQEVAGLVWLDAFHRDWDDFVPAELSLAASDELAPTEEQLRQALPFMREFVAQMLADYPEHVRESLVEYHVSDRWIHAGIAERASMAALAQELRAGADIPDVPLIALTPLAVDPAQQALMSEEALREMHEGKTRLYASMVNAVSDGEQRILTDTNHSQLCFERADLVVQAIHDVVDRATARA
ncbi:pimeloyl-ACP methyl ester carboxylesterase [Kitasatospora sp. GP30]|uniref:alpha/beta fold hydrolase n=1 Tax=Kitasatospora sp. GP30 TaxID=3035084 RepID=UPI000C709B23|nr:alpha/beta fold hydrolase [Kitasatospora sp. GP30]MDH6141298.1 pimeloyl-ACP methyl ester carboxylesterase [Kitasatospora sp. GP30]